MMLKMIHHGKQNLPPRILVYGTEGVGKSTFASGTPNPIFVPTEDGIGQISTSSFPLSRTFSEFIRYLDTLVHEDHSYSTVVVDSLDWLERLVHDDVCREYGVRSIEKADGGYGKGYVHALTQWRKVLDLLQTLRIEKKMIVILIAHAKVETHSDPESASFDRFSPKLHKAANALLCEWCDMILLATRKRGASLGERRGGRILRCVGSPTCVAKNRFALPEELPLVWTSLMQAICTPPPAGPDRPSDPTSESPSAPDSEQEHN